VAQKTALVVISVIVVVLIFCLSSEILAKT